MIEPAPARATRAFVIGAGLSGLACARTLADHGLDVTVFDKGRSPGGRATSRREEGERIFDHGAQFFTVRGGWLTRHVAEWEREGVVARWSPRIRSTSDSELPKDAWWVGTPRMGALAARLARGLDVRLGNAVSSVARRSGAWSLSFAPGAAVDAPSTADALVLAVPASQCTALLDGVSSVLTAVGPVTQTPTWAVMVALRGDDLVGADVLEARDGPIAWAARENSKPGRAVAAGEELWTLHASTAWSELHLEDPPDVVRDALVSAFLAPHGLDSAAVLHAKAHRWRFARGRARGAPHGALVDPSNALAVCGDWLEGARVESALASGVAAAARILALDARALADANA